MTYFGQKTADALTGWVANLILQRDAGKKYVNHAQALKVKTKLSVHWLNNPKSVLSALSSLHCFTLQLVHCWILSTRFPSEHSRKLKKRKPEKLFFCCYCYQLWISKQHSTAQKPLQDNSLEVFQKHMIIRYFDTSGMWDTSFWYLFSHGIFLLQLI